MAVKNSCTAFPHGDPYWTFTFWAKAKGNNIGPHVFRYSEDDNQLHHHVGEQAEIPPAKINLWWKERPAVEPGNLQQDSDGRQDKLHPVY
jgi:hypothetical protein